MKLRKEENSKLVADVSDSGVGAQNGVGVPFPNFNFRRKSSTCKQQAYNSFGGGCFFKFLTRGIGR